MSSLKDLRWYAPKKNVGDEKVMGSYILPLQGRPLRSYGSFVGFPRVFSSCQPSALTYLIPIPIIEGAPIQIFFPGDPHEGKLFFRYLV